MNFLLLLLMIISFSSFNVLQLKVVMSALQQSDEEVNQLMIELKGHVESVKKATTAPERKQMDTVAKQVYKKARQAVNSFGSEVRAEADQTQKAVFQRKHQAYTEQLKELDQALRAAANPAKVDPKKRVISQEETLMGEGGVDGSGFQNANQVLEAGQRINDDALAALARAERLAINAEDTGQETLTTLQKQSETIHQTQEQLNQLGSMIDRAKKDVSWFARQLAGDRCFIMIFFLVVLAIAGVVFYLMYSSRKEKAAASTPTPAPTQGPPVPPPV